MISQPSRLVFWRCLLAISALLAWLAARDAILLAARLGISPLSSKTWLALLGGMALLGAGSLLGLAASFAPPVIRRGRWFGGLRALAGPRAQVPAGRLAGGGLLAVCLAAYPLILFQPYYANLLDRAGGMRMLLFWGLTLLGTQGLRMAWPRSSAPLALLVTVLLQTTVQIFTLYLPDISTYPFAMGWSETSRFYWPSLFVGRLVYGQPVAWPILHPTLHFLLIPPYLFNAPVWFHRFWQVAVRFLLVGLIAPALVYRLSLPWQIWRWLVGVGIFVALFTLPLYLHLAIPVFIVLWGFSAQNERRTWFWLLVAALWAGLSRLNWYPVPGMLAAALYFLETPDQGRGWRYLLKPAAWFAVSTLLAAGAMQVYILLSGIPNLADFYTSLSSSKLWFRLLPNDTNSLGVLPGILLYSLPFGLALLAGWRHMRAGQAALALSTRVWMLLLGELLVLFVGGLVVSTKIGGGGDIHNMDAYAVLLIIITASVWFGPRFRAPVQAVQPAPQPPALHWSIVVLFVLIPAWFAVQPTATFWQYNPANSQATLQALQSEVDKVNAGGGQILFITQRHLISMHMLSGVRLVQEYEREELMEMAMAQNDAYLQRFRADLENHRFAAIVVDPLRFNLVGEQDSMGAENNAWTRSVVKRILCNYQQAEIFPADRIAIYVPQVGTQKCP